jgi:uncharacterized protein involved in exopolysaccharide biosynthesis
LGQDSINTKNDGRGEFLIFVAYLISVRTMVVRISLLFFLAGIALAIFRKPEYIASTTLTLASADASDFSQLRGLASQFGVNVGSIKSSQLAPELVAKIAVAQSMLRSRALDTLVFRIDGDKPRDVLGLLDLSDPDRSSREIRIRKAIRVLEKMVSATADRRTGAVLISAKTKWPELSLHLVNAISTDLEQRMFDIGGKRASKERQSIEERIKTQDDRLRHQEYYLSKFLTQNRQYSNSPELRFEFDRLQRSVSLQQQVLLSLLQAKEDVLSREIQSAPTINVIEPPLYPVLPEPRRRLLFIVISLFAAPTLGIGFAFLRFYLASKLTELKKSMSS